MKYRFLFVPILLVLVWKPAFSQDLLSQGQLHGDFLIDAAYYLQDSTILAQELPEDIGMNAYGNFNYTSGRFKAGVRVESYETTLIGFDPKYSGTELAYRYAQYQGDELDITVGNFYEQFGNGLSLRAYWEWYLGLDNNIDGVKVHYKPAPGVFLKGIVGKQRFYFEKGPGIVRGVDGEFALNEIFNQLSEAKTKIIIGASGVSRYQEDQNSTLILPENVSVFAGRLNLSYQGFNLNSEYAYKINDPSSQNNNSYEKGEALLVNASYTGNNYGLNLGFKRWDNMDFRSDRGASGFDLNTNYQPALTRQHTYRLTSLYSYPTVPAGEIALQGDIYYNIKRGTKLGGKYGTNISINVSFVNDIERILIDSGARGEYNSGFFTFGNEVFYRDINFEISRKISKKFKVLLSGMRQFVNYTFQPATLTGNPEEVETYIALSEISYSTRRNKKRYVSRLELQHLWTEQDFQNWFTAVFEQTFTNHWYISILSEYNYNNNIKERRNLYLSGSVGYRKDTYSIRLGGGRQRGGFLCVGGICRPVPANTGINLTISNSF